VSIVVTPEQLNLAATTLRQSASQFHRLPSGHGLTGRADVLGLLDRTHRHLASLLDEDVSWLKAAATALNDGATAYRENEAALAGSMDMTATSDNS
jgi:hypothetical protein